MIRVCLPKIACPIDWRLVTEVIVGDKTLDVVDRFCLLGDTLSSGSGCISAIIHRCKVALGKELPILKSMNLPLLVRGRGTTPVCDLLCSVVAKLGPRMTGIFSACSVMIE